MLGDMAALSESLKRLSMIIATIVLGYLAVPISQARQIDDKYRNIFISTIFYFSYIVFINLISKAFDDSYLLALSFITLHVVYLLITYIYYRKSEIIIN